MNRLEPTQAINDKLIARWLITCAVVIFGMILLGGVTRLTDSGLSMVEWNQLWVLSLPRPS